MSEFARFMRGRLIEALLLAIASAMLFSTITYGFHVEDALRANWVALLLVPLCTVLCLNAASFSPKTAVFGSIGFVVVAAGIVVAAGAATGHAFFYDEYGNMGFFILLGVLVTVLGYVLTRRKTTAYIYAAGGCFACAVVQFLYVNNLLVQAILFMAAAVALCTVCSARLSAKVIAADDVPAWQFLVTGLCLAVIALVVSGGIYVAVIAPLNPPAQEIKLVTEYYALETVHVRGTQMVEHKENDDLVSDNEEQGDKQTNNENDNTQEIQGDQSNNTAVGQKGDESFGRQGYNITGFGQDSAATRYFNDPVHVMWGVVLVLLVIVIVILIRRLLRRRRYSKMLALPPAASLKAFYLFFDKRLGLLGVKRNVSATPLEHANNVSASVAPLEQGAQDDANYTQLAQAYSACAFGNVSPSDEALACCKNLYAVFYKNARAYLGSTRYLLRFFKL